MRKARKQVMCSALHRMLIHSRVDMGNSIDQVESPPGEQIDDPKQLGMKWQANGTRTARRKFLHNVLGDKIMVKCGGKELGRRVVLDVLKQGRFHPPEGYISRPHERRVMHVVQLSPQRVMHSLDRVLCRHIVG